MLDIETQHSVAELVQILLGESNSQRPDQELHYGAIVSEQSDGTCTVQIEGVATDIAGIRKLSGVNTTPLTVCLLARIGADWVILGSLSDGEEWIAYDPTVNSSGFTKGSGGTITGRYRQVGHVCFFTIAFTWGTGSSFAAPLKFGLPTDRANNQIEIGSVAAVHNAGSVPFCPGVWFSSEATHTTRIAFPDETGFLGTGSAYIDNTHPFNWAATDTLWISGHYETALP